MKVRELIEILQTHDLDMDVMSTDFDGWCYVIDDVAIECSDSDGRLCPVTSCASTGPAVMLKAF